jgi:tRNA(Ile2) C34 agmatinyltransferase TiaS
MPSWGIEFAALLIVAVGLALVYVGFRRCPRCGELNRRQLATGLFRCGHCGVTYRGAVRRRS